MRELCFDFCPFSVRCNVACFYSSFSTAFLSLILPPSFDIYFSNYFQLPTSTNVYIYDLRLPSASVSVIYIYPSVSAIYINHLHILSVAVIYMYYLHLPSTCVICIYHLSLSFTYTTCICHQHVPSVSTIHRCHLHIPLASTIYMHHLYLPSIGAIYTHLHLPPTPTTALPPSTSPLRLSASKRVEIL